MCIQPNEGLELAAWGGSLRAGGAGGVDHLPTDILTRHPKLAALFEAVGAHEQIAAYYAAHT